MIANLLEDLTEHFYQTCKSCKEEMLNQETGEVTVHWILCCDKHKDAAHADSDPSWVAGLRRKEQELLERIQKGERWIEANVDDHERFATGVALLGRLDRELRGIRETFERIKLSDDGDRVHSVAASSHPRIEPEPWKEDTEKEA